jgi:hypothetical protein
MDLNVDRALFLQCNVLLDTYWLFLLPQTRNGHFSLTAHIFRRNAENFDTSFDAHLHVNLVYLNYL